MIFKRMSNLLIVKRLLKLGLFSLVLDTETTLGDWGLPLFCESTLITSETSLVPVGGYDSDFYFVEAIATYFIDTVPNLGDEIVVGVYSMAPKLLLPQLRWVPKLLRPM